MTRLHRAPDVVPLPVDFRTDDELRVYLGLPDTPQGRRILAKVTPEERKEYAEMRAVERQLMKGHVPSGAIACSRGRRK